MKSDNSNSDSQLQKTRKTLVEFMFYFERKIPGLREKLVKADPSSQSLLDSLDVLAIDDLDIIKLVFIANSVISDAVDCGSALTFLVDEGEAKFIDFLISNALIDLNKPNRYGVPAILKAAWRPDSEILQLLCSKASVDINATSRSGVTALIYSCLAGSESKVEILLRSENIDVGKRCREVYQNIHSRHENPVNDWSAADYAAFHRHVNILKLLAKNHEIVIDPSYRIIKNVLLLPYEPYLLFLRPEIDVNTIDESGQTLLMKLVRHEKSALDSIRCLLRNTSLNINIKNDTGQTAFQIAVESGRYDEACLLLRHPEIDHRFKGKDGKTALMHAAHSLLLTESLLALPNIDVFEEDVNGKTAMDYCCIEKISILLKEAQIKNFYESALRTDARDLNKLLKKCSRYHYVTIDRVIQYILEIADLAKTNEAKLAILNNVFDNSTNPHALSEYLLYFQKRASTITRIFSNSTNSASKQLIDKIRQIETQQHNMSLNSSQFMSQYAGGSSHAQKL